MVVRGAGGSIVAGSRQTARVEAWEVSRASAAPVFQVTARVVDVDTWRWRQALQTVRLRHANRTWAWTVDTLGPVEDTVTFMVNGPPEVR